MVAADVDSDLLDVAAPDNNDGNAVANLTYPITALYSGRDSVLDASAGLKHFGVRCLGTHWAFESCAFGRSSFADRQRVGCRLFQLFPRLHKPRNGRCQDSLKFLLFFS
jgi:hypothetical protein